MAFKRKVQHSPKASPPPAPSPMPAKPKERKVTQVYLDGTAYMADAVTGEILDSHNGHETEIFTAYNKRKADELLSMISIGTKLDDALNFTGLTLATFNYWKATEQDFKTALTQARENRSDLVHEAHFADDIDEIIKKPIGELTNAELAKYLKKQKLLHNFQKMDAPQKFDTKISKEYILTQSHQTFDGSIQIDIDPNLLSSLNQRFNPKMSSEGTVVIDHPTPTEAKEYA